MSEVAGQRQDDDSRDLPRPRFSTALIAAGFFGLALISMVIAVVLTLAV